MLSYEIDSLRSWRFVWRFVLLLTSGSGCWPQCKVKNEKKRLSFWLFSTLKPLLNVR